MDGSEPAASDAVSRIVSDNSGKFVKSHALASSLQLRCVVGNG